VIYMAEDSARLGNSTENNNAFCVVKGKNGDYGLDTKTNLYSQTVIEPGTTDGNLYRDENAPNHDIKTIPTRRKHYRKPRSEMGRYPFIVCIGRFLADTRVYFAESTYKEHKRKLKYLNRVFVELRREGNIDTTNPEKFAKKEIDAFLLWMEEKKLDQSTRVKYLNYLNNLLVWCNNPVIENMKKSRFTQFPKRIRKELDPLPQDAVEYILDCTQQLKGWNGIVLRTALHLYAFTGLRPSELRCAKIDDIDLATWTLRVSCPKGKNRYGRQRKITLLRQCQEALIEYLEVRKRYLQDNRSKDVEPLFPYINRYGTVRYWSHAEWRKLKRNFEKEANIRFKFKDFRASFAQRIIDSGGQIEHVSKALGHATTATTEQWYGRIRDADAWKGIEAVLGTGASKIPLVKVETPRCKKPQSEI
jgi:integrase